MAEKKVTIKLNKKKLNDQIKKSSRLSLTVISQETISTSRAMSTETLPGMRILSITMWPPS
ncbi:hypothetical protein HMPREF9058_0120 [Actinomyces sp. oral taxon 175 str. F0384]|nr:hypothetical protein HMPREF9058_0120 [Actinomyces sp. oral taxon 175 str. F0384]